jgi:hypothetical protein
MLLSPFGKDPPTLGSFHKKKGEKKGKKKGKKRKNTTLLILFVKMLKILNL